MEKFSEYLKAVEEEKFRAYEKLLLSYNQRFNLTSITDEREIQIKHFFDSVSGERFLPQGAHVVDVGAGAGFPSLPLKIFREDLSFTLIESTGKKCEFLKTAIKELGLENVEVRCMRAEDAGRGDLREKFDCCVARAVAKMNTLSEYCLPLIKVGGIFLAYKGEAEEEMKEARNAISILGGKIGNTERFFLPEGMGSRTLILIEKNRPTPQKYPRGQGKERLKPI